MKTRKLKANNKGLITALKDAIDMKRFTRIFLALLLIFSLMAGLSPAFASGEEKNESGEQENRPEFLSEEVIYALMSSSGNIDGIYSVCLLDSEKKSRVSYFGPFEEVENLSDTQKIKLKGDEAVMNLPKGKFYFKSYLATRELPWYYDISYKLDGKEISAENLGGKSGLLEISLKSGANENVDESFRKSFFSQISISLDAEKTGKIESEDATIANAGGVKLLTLFGLPGSDIDVTVKAEVEDFEMPGISIAAVPFSMADQLGEVKDLTNGLVQLSNAVSALNAGASQLAGGINQLKDGSSKFGDGLVLLSQNSGTLRDGSAQVLAAVSGITEMLTTFSALAENFDVSALAFLPGSLIALADALDAAANSLAAVPGGINEAIAAFSAAMDNIGTVDEAGIAELLANNPDSAALLQLIANYRATMALKEIWQATVGNLQVSGDTTAGIDSIRGMSAKLRELASTVQGVIDAGGTGNLGDLTAGLNQFAGSYGQLHNGIVQYTQGVDTLASNWAQLYGGMTQLSDGANQLSGGLGQLSAGTAGIPAKIKELMGDMELGEYEPLSFLSEKNKSCTLVQFVIMTDPIEAPPEEAPELAPEPEKSFWERLADLFVSEDEKTPAESQETDKSTDTNADKSVDEGVSVNSEKSPD